MEALQKLLGNLEISILEYIGLGIVAFMTLLVIFIRKNLTEYLFFNIWKKIKKKFRKSRYDKQEVDKDTKIREILIELRTLTHSQRSSVFQFHNGNVFTSKNPIWKISNTHESVAAGTSTEIGALQDIKASAIIDLVSCFWDNKPKSGVYQISPEFCDDNCPHKKESPHDKKVFFYSVAELEEGYSKTLLMQQGIHYILLSPLCDRDSHYIGFIWVNYCEENKNIEKIKKRSSILCRHSSHISFALVNS